MYWQRLSLPRRQPASSPVCGSSVGGPKRFFLSCPAFFFPPPFFSARHSPTFYPSHFLGPMTRLGFLLGVAQLPRPSSFDHLPVRRGLLRFGLGRVALPSTRLLCTPPHPIQGTVGSPLALPAPCPPRWHLARVPRVGTSKWCGVAGLGLARVGPLPQCGGCCRCLAPARNPLPALPM